MPTHSGLEERRLGLEEEGRLVVERRRWAWRSSLPPWTPAGVGSGIRRWSRTESRRRWTESNCVAGGWRRVVAGGLRTPESLAGPWNPMSLAALDVRSTNRGRTCLLLF
uniref:Predicted protein n=1 Tax=Hordeum vulgare subsp. vulgare TaxID=112509 RepID=F2E364_HORVV|nr:predicted protein [Hordeum vulgare subsp. vulgare]